MTIKLLPHEMRILTAVQLNAGENNVTLSKKTGCSARQTRYAVRKFRSLDLIRRRPLINTSLLGYTVFSVFLDVGFPTKSDRRKWMKRLAEHPSIVYLCEVAGDYSLAIDICAWDALSVHRILSELSEGLDITVQRRTFGLRISFTIYRRRILENKAFLPDRLTVQREERLVPIDDLSRDILAALSEPYVSKRQIAKKLDISHATLEARLIKLQQQGVFKGEIYGIYSEKLGLLTFYALIRLRKRSPDISERMLRLARRIPGVVILIEYLGEWDFQIVVETWRSADLLPAIELLQEELTGFIDSLTVMHLIKVVKIGDYPVNNPTQLNL